MIQNYIEQSTRKVRHCIEIAIGEMAAMRQNTLTPDYLLLALLSQADTEAMKIISQLVTDKVDAVTRLKGEIYQYYKLATPVQATQIVVSQELEAVFRVAFDEGRQLGDDFVSTGTLFVALCDPVAGHTATLLNGAGIQQKQAREALKTLRGGRSFTSEDAESEADVLSKDTLDLTEMARQGALDPVIGRELEIGQIIQTLSRRKKNNPAVIGEAGVGKTVIVEGLAQRIAAADLPDTLLNKRILSLDMAEIVAGAKMRGEFE